MVSMFNLRNYIYQQLKNRNGLFDFHGIPSTYVHTKAAHIDDIPIEIPNNINDSETTLFSPHRTRDISANFISQHINNSSKSGSNITTETFDKHLISYDCNGAISLNSVMQSNVPTPFGGMHKFSHLNMPGGQWSQDCKYISQNLQYYHLTHVRQRALSNCSSSIQKSDYWNNKVKRSISYQKEGKPNKSNLSNKEKLKKAFKEYGSTVIVFHIAMSLISLEICYLLVSGGINMMPILEYLGLGSTTLSNKMAAGASTFVVAYAVHKVFAPIRISITLSATPFIVRYLRTRGILKSTPAK